MCKELLDMCAVADDDYIERAKALIRRHAKKTKKQKDPSCDYSGCVHHERITRRLGLAMLRIGDGADPWRDVRGVKVSTIPLIVTKRSHPKGWDMKRSDIVRRSFNGPDTAGDIYLRFGPKTTWVHVWISPYYSTRRAKLDDPAAIWEVLEAFEKRMEAMKEWCLSKFNGLKELAEMDLQFDDE